MKLRQLNKSDLQKIMEWRNEQMLILRQYKPLTMYNQEQWWEKLSTDPHQIIFGIEDEPGDLIGYCGLVYIDWVNQRAEMSMIFKTIYSHDMEKHKEAIELLLEYAFEDINLNKITVEFFEARVGNYGLMIKEVGFVHEGTLREHTNLKTNYIYSILKKEWEQTRR